MNILLSNLEFDPSIEMRQSDKRTTMMSNRCNEIEKALKPGTSYSSIWANLFHRFVASSAPKIKLDEIKRCPDGLIVYLKTKLFLKDIYSSPKLKKLLFCD